MLRHFTSQIAPTLRRVTGFYQARGRDPETEQAWLRVSISALALGWCMYLVYAEGELTDGLVLAIIAAGIAVVVGIAMLVVLSHTRKHVVLLRYLGIFTDMAAISVGMAGADEGGVPMIGVYLWVTVGNGFRFGPRYLMAAYWLQLLGFGLQLVFVPFWISHRAIGLGLLLALAIVPLYVLVLLSRLTAQKDAAEQLSNAKSRFVANVSHELRTPLTGVFAVYELLRMGAKRQEDQELIGMLGNAISTLKTSVDAVLQMSKLEAGAERTNARLFNVWRFLHQIEALAKPQATAKNIRWSLGIADDVPSLGFGDPDHLTHVLGNLVNNALKFTHVGSVELRALRAGSGVRFEVQDTGIGIPKLQQEHLFERFVQVDNSATRRYGGTGLGTSIARDLVELMGGRIGVQSEPGQGSTFWVELDLSIPVDAAEPSELLERGTVVLVRTPASRETQHGDLLAAIQSTGAHAVVADVGTDSLLDPGGRRRLATVIQMTPANAADYVEKKVLACDGLVTPLIAVATHWSSVERRRLIELGADDLLTEPVTHDAMRRSLRAIVGLGSGNLVAELGATPGSTAHRRLSILLADDNPSNRMLLARILRDAGHAVRTAARGDEAFDVMSSGTVDLAILDLNMPDMTGPDVVKLYLASSVGTSRVPILILSADATPAARTESLESGADAFLTKPVTGAALLGAIDRLFGEQPEALADTGVPPSEIGAEGIGVVDLDRLAALRNIARGDAAFLDQYIAAAFEEIECAMKEVNIAALSGEMRKARDALHIIEGTGASIGGVALLSACRSIRQRLPELATDRADPALVDFAAILARTRAEVLASMRQRSDGAAPHRLAG